MRKIDPISGFPEWLPEQRLIELAFLDRIRQKFELFGYLPIETRAVESLDNLLKQGETDKEIYVLRRLQAGSDEGDTQLGLHYDLTVPFARYVVQHRGNLSFPFKRYQIQKAWRGERPQEGRYREFYQADIDVIDENGLSLHFDAEIPLVIYEVLASLPIPPMRLSINNRKVLEGFYRGLGLDPVQPVLRAVDKLDKIGPANLRKVLGDDLRLSPTQVDLCLKLAEIQTPDPSFAERVRALGVEHPLLETGLQELSFVMEAVGGLPTGTVVADLHIARGFDYYTGTVYETVMQGHEDLGAVCSGGRYDDLASSGSSVKYPGVGVSVGVSRILGRLFGRGQLRASHRAPTRVLVALVSEEGRAAAGAAARQLRERGIAVEVFHEPLRFGRQIRYAERKGIPFVWFPPAESGASGEVKDIRSGEQQPADPATWSPPAEDLELALQLV